MNVVYRLSKRQKLRMARDILAKHFAENHSTDYALDNLYELVKGLASKEDVKNVLEKMVEDGYLEKVIG
jgi:uncharacterized protein YeeX (DUF496 family)